MAAPAFFYPYRFKRSDDVTAMAPTNSQLHLTKAVVERDFTRVREWMCLLCHILEAWL